MKPIGRYLEERGISVAQLIKDTGMDAKQVKAIVSGNYTASPSQRQRLSAALGIAAEEVSWDHGVPV